MVLQHRTSLCHRPAPLCATGPHLFVPQAHSSLPEHGLTHSQIHTGAHHVDVDHG